MNTNSVCAVLVTFFPKDEVLRNIATLRSQTEALVVVDNGSSSDLRAPLRAASRDLGFTLVENGNNRGIAAALNTGVQWALTRGYRWVALFDQDSTAAERMIEAMTHAYHSSPDPDKVAIVTPRHVEGPTGVWNRPLLFTDGGNSPMTAITSGSLIPARIFRQCGEFEEDLFIDCVDHEYSLRVRSLGYTILLCEDAILHHAVGAPEYQPLPGTRIRLRTLNHRAERRYYIARNEITLIRRYWARYPRWCFIEVLSWLREAIKTMLVEDDRRKKMSMIAAGIIDGFRGKLGPVVKI
jgi:rhamnosyltransferase